MLDAIKQFHCHGYVHNDIKPHNFVVGLGSKSNKVHLLDFGFSSSYVDAATGRHIAFEKTNKLQGTPFYASLNTLCGYVKSRRDDVESLGYVLT